MVGDFGFNETHTFGAMHIHSNISQGRKRSPQNGGVPLPSSILTEEGGYEFPSRASSDLLRWETRCFIFPSLVNKGGTLMI